MVKRPDSINTTVSSAATAVQIGTIGDAPVQEAWFRPNVGINGIIYIGDQSVSATNGWPMQDGDALKLSNPDGDPVDLAMWYIDASVSGEGGVTLFQRDD